MEGELDTIYTINIMNIRGVYYLYINGKLYCTCDSLQEVYEELNSIGA